MNKDNENENKYREQLNPKGIKIKAIIMKEII